MMHTKIEEKASKIAWAATIEGAEKVEKAKVGKREYQALPRLATENIPYVRFALMGKRGGYYVALPTTTEGIFQVTSIPGANFMGYVKIVDDVLVDAPEYR